MKAKKVIFFSLYAVLILALQFFPISIFFPVGDTTFATYDLSQKKEQPGFVTIKGERIMGAVYYRLNDSNWLSYLTTTFDSSQQKTIDITVRLRHLNLNTHTNSSIVVFRDEVADGIDRYPYTNLQIYNITKDTVIFSSIYRNADHYFYQHLDRAGKIVQSVRVFDADLLTTYFNPSNMMEINTTTFGVVIGKQLSERSTVTGKYILLYNRQSNQTKEIEMQFEISSVVFNQDSKQFDAIYTNENGGTSLGIFYFHGSLDEYIADSSATIDYLINSSTLLIRPNHPVTWGWQIYVVLGIIGVIVITIMEIRNRRKRKKTPIQPVIYNRYLQNQDEPELENMDDPEI